MRIVLFGATGLTGNEILKQAIEDGHKITVIVRNPNSIEIKHPNLTIEEGDVLKLQSFEYVMKDSDVVISTVGTGTSFSKARKPITRGIFNCRDSSKFKVCSPLQLSCNFDRDEAYDRLLFLYLTLAKECYTE